MTNGTTSHSSSPLIVQVLPAAAGTCLVCWFLPAVWLVIWPYLLTGLLVVTVYLSIKISKDRAKLKDLLRQRKSSPNQKSISPTVHSP